MLTRFIRLVQFEFRRFKGRSKLGLIFILIIPLLYGGIYLHANWDLYSNTNKVKIAVVNHDKPATFGGRTVNGGQEFQNSLKKNPRFDWQFLGTDENKAYQGLRDAEYFMIIEVPEDFSTNIVSAGDFRPARATLQLHRDDANGFIIGLLTSQVQTALEQALDQSVSETYFNALFVNLGVIKQSLSKASDGSAQIDNGLKTLDAGVTEMNNKVLGATKAVGDSTTTVNQVNSALANADSAAAKTSSAVTQTRVGAQAITGAAQNVMADSQAVNSAMVPLINNVTKNLPTLQKQARNLVSVTGTLQNPNGDSVIKIQHDVTGVVNKATALAAKHPELAGDPDYIALVKQINGAASSTTTVSSNIAAVANVSVGLNLSLNQQNADTLANNATAALGRLNKDAQQVNNGLETINGAMDTADSVAKDLNKAVNDATDAGRSFTAKAPQIVSGVMQLSNGLGQLKTGSDNLSKGATQLHRGLDSGAKQIPGLSDDKRSNLANIMSSPVDIEQTILHSAKYYGRGLAPMFFSIAMWIACISTFLVVRTFSGRAMTGRANSLSIALVGFGPLAVIALAGAYIMAFGVWLILGLDPVHPWYFIGFVTLASLSWMMLAFWMRLIFGSPQTAIFLILLVLQLPTCGGTFPVTMLPPVYQKLAVVMPMKYSVDAFRVLISGGPMSTLTLGFAVEGGILVISMIITLVLVHRHKLFRMRDLHPPMITSTSTADFAFSVRPR